mmetsp:Transcript_10260/g.27215  ORF Transcript_10260/g.27215 Transcript_10260/m.27215 type:complete len:258 (+) Transcript_10260:301-1074(+)
MDVRRSPALRETPDHNRTISHFSTNIWTRLYGGRIRELNFEHGAVQRLDGRLGELFVQESGHYLFTMLKHDWLQRQGTENLELGSDLHSNFFWTRLQPILGQLRDDHMLARRPTAAWLRTVSHDVACLVADVADARLVSYGFPSRRMAIETIWPPAFEALPAKAFGRVLVDLAPMRMCKKAASAFTLTTKSAEGYGARIVFDVPASWVDVGALGTLASAAELAVLPAAALHGESFGRSGQWHELHSMRQQRPSGRSS